MGWQEERQLEREADRRMRELLDGGGYCSFMDPQERPILDQLRNDADFVELNGPEALRGEIGVYGGVTFLYGG
jgi:hypothetical protein